MIGFLRPTPTRPEGTEGDRMALRMATLQGGADRTTRRVTTLCRRTKIPCDWATWR